FGLFSAIITNKKEPNIYFLLSPEFPRLNTFTQLHIMEPTPTPPQERPHYDNPYDNIPGYVESVYHVMQAMDVGCKTNPNLATVAKLVYQYIRAFSASFRISLKEIKPLEPGKPVNLIPIFEYVTANGI